MDSWFAPFLAALLLTTTNRLPAVSAELGLPPSRDRIFLRIITTDGVDGTLTVVDGGSVRVSRVGTGAVEIVASLDGDVLSLAVSLIESNDEGSNEGTQEIGRARLARGRSARISTPALSFELTWLRSEPSPPSPTGQLASGPCTICCITCLGYTMCACEVVMECGRCCCPAGGCGCQLTPARSGAPAFEREARRY